MNVTIINSVDLHLSLWLLLFIKDVKSKNLHFNKFILTHVFTYFKYSQVELLKSF